MGVRARALASRIGLRSRSLLRSGRAPVPHVAGLLFSVVLAILTGRALELPFVGGLAIAIVVLRMPLDELPRTRWRSLLVTADAVLTAIALLLTGAPFSPLLPLAMTGAIDAGSRSRADGWTFGLSFLVTYLPVAAIAVLLGDPGIRRAEFLMEIGKTTTLVPLSVVIGWATGVAPLLEPLYRSGPLRQVSERREDIRARVDRALRDEPLPVDTLIAGAKLGLTVEETELLGFLVMGMTNQQMADAFCLSVATVKYRLTRLYRRLDVRGRPQAIAVARRLGLDGLPLEPLSPGVRDEPLEPREPLARVGEGERVADPR